MKMKKILKKIPVFILRKTLIFIICLFAITASAATDNYKLLVIFPETTTPFIFNFKNERVAKETQNFINSQYLNPVCLTFIIPDIEPVPNIDTEILIVTFPYAPNPHPFIFTFNTDAAASTAAMLMSKHYSSSVCSTTVFTNIPPTKKNRLY
jgi:hypothetical protein